MAILERSLSSQQNWVLLSYRSRSQHCATKDAVKGLAGSLREEMNAEDVRMLSIYLRRTGIPVLAKVHSG
jgi:NADP-dependent 3-hydroxy acid dehydrogenase YdfG